MTSSDAVGEARIIVGVDTHRDEHVAVPQITLVLGWVTTGCLRPPSDTEIWIAGEGGWGRWLPSVLKVLVPTAQDWLGTWPAVDAPSSRSADPIDPQAQAG